MANTIIAFWCEWIKIIPILFVRLAKNVICLLVCRRILVVSLRVCYKMKKVENCCSRQTDPQIQIFFWGKELWLVGDMQRWPEWLDQSEQEQEWREMTGEEVDRSLTTQRTWMFTGWVGSSLKWHCKRGQKPPQGFKQSSDVIQFIFLESHSMGVMVGLGQD